MKTIAAFITSALIVVGSASPSWAVFPFCSSGRCSAPVSPQGIHFPQSQWVVPQTQLGGTVVIPSNIPPFAPGTVVYTPTQTSAEPKWWPLNNDSYGRNHVGLWVGERYLGRLDPELGRWMPAGADDRGWVDLADVGGLAKPKGAAPMPRDYVPSKIGEQLPYGELKSGARSKSVDSAIEEKLTSAKGAKKEDDKRDTTEKDRDEKPFVNPVNPGVFTQGPAKTELVQADKKAAEKVEALPNELVPERQREEGMRIERLPGTNTPILNFGLTQEGISKVERFTLDGHEATPREAIQAIQSSQLSNDARNPWLVIVGSPSARERVVRDFTTSPLLAPWANRVRLAAFDPTNHRVISGKFPTPATSDGVVIRYQSPSGHDLHLQSDYDGPQGLAAALTRADRVLATRADLMTATRELRDPNPGYDPRSVPDLRREIRPGPDPTRGGAGWWMALPVLAAVGGLTFLVYWRRR